MNDIQNGNLKRKSFWPLLFAAFLVASLNPNPSIAQEPQRASVEGEGPQNLVDLSQYRIMFSQQLDQADSLRVEFRLNLDTRNYVFHFFKNNHQFRKDPQVPPKNMIDGLAIYVDGKKKTFALGPYLNSTSGHFPLSLKRPTIKIEFLGKTLGKYQLDLVKRVARPLKSPEILSTFDMRRLHKMNSLNKLPPGNISTVATGSLSITSTDLHTHFTGALQSEDLITTALDFQIPYPAQFLDELGISYDQDLAFEKDGIKYVPLHTSHLRKNGKSDDALQALYESFQIGLDETKPFTHLEDIYKYREGIIKHKDNPANKVFARLLTDLVKDYVRMGINYAELSFSKVKELEWLEEATQVLPKLEQLYGVKIRFLISLRRVSHLNGCDGENMKLVKQIIGLEDNPFIVGVDIVGEELNPITDCTEVLNFFSEYRKMAPHFQVRVHAGETPHHPENVKKAIELGATRIGHGLYGIDKEVLEMARKNDVIVEMNLDSNFALENIQDIKPFKDALRAYLDAGVRITLGTDGHAIYNNSLQSAEAVLKGLGITEKEWERIQKSNNAYVENMEKVFAQKMKKISVPSRQKASLKKKIDYLLDTYKENITAALNRLKNYSNLQPQCDEVTE